MNPDGVNLTDFFDPFGGGGSTYQAAETHCRNWFGTELFDTEHIRSRMQEEFSLSSAQEPIFNYQSLFSNEDKQTAILRRVEGDYPIILMAVEHDGFAEEPLPKKRTNRGRA